MPEWFVPVVQKSGHLLLMAIPGLLPLLLLPLARLVSSKAEHANRLHRAKIWTGAMALSLGLLAILTATPLTHERLWPVVLTMLLTGIAYIRVGANCLAAFIGRCHQRLLTLAGSLALACALFMLANVLMRHVFAVGMGWARETVIYAYAGCFMLGAAGTLLNDGHVRIDIIRERLPQFWRARLELFGSLFLLVPVMLLILHVYAPQLALAWGAGSGRLEASDEGDGLPLAFLFKSLIPVFALTLLAQGWAIAWQAARFSITDTSDT